MAEWVFTVSEVTEYIKRMVAAEELLQNMRVRGEVSGLRRAASGHIYFTLKDAASQMQCVYFKQDQNSSAANLAEGMQVTLSGRMALYAAAGQLNFYVKSVQNDGVGSLYAMLEQRKERLRRLGYFDDGHKKPLPAFPCTLGVVTSRQGAVLRDIIRVATRRNPHIVIVLYPVRVQGEGAAREIVRGIQRLGERDDIDVIIVGRGGGSFEDLFEFHDEELVKAVYHSAVPIISAVGHEVDFTLCDFAADVRAATPSEAAEIAVPDRDLLQQRINEQRMRLGRLAGQR
ncbi:MAG: exodeoxyribonuclease VII large subunit, partial [Eubacteriales bacterium]|nr:exodeoxyribonuclease VII large subunit [Eubacteriales bacterium]